MRGVTLVCALVILAQGQLEESDKSVHNVVDDMVGRALEAPPAQQAALDDTAVGKTAQLARPPSSLSLRSALPATGMKPMTPGTSSVLSREPRCLKVYGLTPAWWVRKRKPPAKWLKAKIKAGEVPEAATSQRWLDNYAMALRVHGKEIPDAVRPRPFTWGGYSKRSRMDDYGTDAYYDRMIAEGPAQPRRLQGVTNPQVFFDMAIGGAPAGRIVMEVRAGDVPRTAEDLCLCDGDHCASGSVVAGMDVAKKLEAVGSQRTSEKVVIADSGQIA